MHFAFISCSVVNMAYLQKPAHEAICIDTRLAAKFCIFFYHIFPQKSLPMSLRVWGKCRAAQVRSGKPSCVLMLRLWALENTLYPNQPWLWGEHRYRGRSKNGRHALNRVSIIHSFIYLGHLRLLHNRESLLWWCIYFQRLGFASGNQVSSGSWFQLATLSALVENSGTREATV